MKLTVWTLASHTNWKSKCVFMGETDILPRKGDEVIVRDGFCCETVHSVSINLVNKVAEIRINTDDKNDDYGPCLYREFLNQKD